MKPHAVILSAVLSLTTAIGCAPERTCSGEWCGTLVIVSGGEPGVLFPPLMQTDVEWAVRDFLFVPLADVGPRLNTVGDSGFVPRLAHAWRFQDSATIRFDLDTEARWQDGAPMTAEDVVFTFDVYRDTLVNSPVRPRLTRITSVTAPNPHTVQIRVDHVYPEAFFDAVYHVRILPRHLLDTVPRARLNQHPFARAPVGGGPFRLIRWDAGETMEFAADSTFFLGRPGLRRIVWRFTQDITTAVPQLLAGEADFLSVLGGPENIERVNQAPHLRVIPYPSSQYTYVAFNLHDPEHPDRPHPLFGDRALRRALTMAVDRTAVMRAVLGAFGEVPKGPVTRSLGIWSDRIEVLPFDSARARATLRQLGWRDTNGDGILDRGGRRLEFDLLVPTSSASRQRAAVIIQDQLKRLGISMQITPLEVNVWLNRANAHRFDALFGGHTLDPSPASIEEAWTSTGLEIFNWGSYVNPNVDRLIQQALTSWDPDSARAKWRAALGLINADAPAIWVYSPIQAAAVHDRFENVSIRPDQWAATMWTWRVPSFKMIDRDRVN